MEFVALCTRAFVFLFHFTFRFSPRSLANTFQNPSSHVYDRDEDGIPPVSCDKVFL